MIVIIAAVARNGVIGHANGLPWRLPEDLARFRAATMGNAVVMGRRTFESIGRPLVRRRTIVVSRAMPPARGIEVARSVEEALALAGSGPVYIAGGAEIYAQTIERADRLLLTLVEADVEGDARFPEVAWDEWREVRSEPGRPAEPAPYAYRFVEYARARREETVGPGGYSLRER